MSDTSTIAVVGTDGIAPIRDTTNRWCYWALGEIWQGPKYAGAGKYIPKVNDYVKDPLTDTDYIVTNIDPVTLIPTLVEKTPNNMSTVLSTNDVLLGVDSSFNPETYRVYIDKTTFPYVVNVDARLKYNGSRCAFGVLFLGTDTSASGTKFSAIYDANGNFITNNVPFEVIAADSHINYAEKSWPECYTTADLPDGELITAVAYNADGAVISRSQLMVVNTAAIRGATDAQRYVTAISLECPWLSATDDTIISYPLNLPMTALAGRGKVHYSNGDTLELPIDGTKFSLEGINQTVSSIINSNSGLMLRYILSADESTNVALSNNNRYIDRAYTLRIVDSNPSYTVKLFGYPEWIDAVNGYRMKFFMLNLDRNLWYDVSALVKFSPATGTFNPLLYGYLQQKSVTLSLKDISGAFKAFNHTQVLDINLLSAPSGRDTAWNVTQSDGADPLYGAGLVAIKQGGLNNIVKIDCGIAAQADWLQAVYYNTGPLVDITKEIKAPMPTHFAIMYNGSSTEYTLDQWNSTLNIGFNVADSANIYIRFFKRTASGDQQLAIAGMRVSQ